MFKAANRGRPVASLRGQLISLSFAFALAAPPAAFVGLSGSLVCLPVPAAAAETQNPLEPLSIVTATGAHNFSVEVMRTAAEHERGLMFRRYLPQDRGMLFNFEVEQPVVMWMKNTYLPLDMIFMDRKGRVVNIAADAEPLSEKLIPSGEPVFAVLEVNGGTAARIGLKIGDQVRNEIFKN